MDDILSRTAAATIIIQICIHEPLVWILLKISRDTLICASRTYTRSIQHEGRPVFAPLFVRKKEEKRARVCKVERTSAPFCVWSTRHFQTKRRLRKRYFRIFIISFALPRVECLSRYNARHIWQYLISDFSINPLEFSLADTRYFRTIDISNLLTDAFQGIWYIKRVS